MKYGTMTYVERGDGGVLMLKKNERVDDPNSGFYTLPGGKLEKNELGVRGRLESVIREVKEETGLILGDINLKGIILFDNSEENLIIGRILKII